MAWTETSITYLKGVGPQRAKTLASELGIRTYGDLLSHYPFRYVDRSVVHDPSTVLASPAEIQVRGRILDVQTSGAGKGRRITAQLVSDQGRLELVWFKGIRYIEKQLNPGREVIAFGRVSEFKGRLSMAHPELEDWESFQSNAIQGLFPVYHSGEKLSNSGLHSKGLAKLIMALLQDPAMKMEEWLPMDLLKQKGWPTHQAAVREMHFPKGGGRLELARQRLAFEELFLDQLVYATKRQGMRSQRKGLVMPAVGDIFKNFYDNILPFEMTGAQKRVIREIREDVKSGGHMNRLVQGDVGSGKTLVAFSALLLAVANGYQGCMMAPTEILAQQHYTSLLPWAVALGLRIELLTGSVKAADRKPILEDLANGSLHLIVGTHALIEDPVQFHNLGLAVVDEQHRFGVKQRAALRAKNKPAPHVLVMTATPIPRTLAMSMYGDLDISVIDEMPPGRKPVQTHHRTDSNRLKVWGFLKEQIALGRQAYIVYPLIEESKKLDYKDLMDGYESICRDFPKPEYQVSIVHGRMKADDKQYEMGRFARGETHIMVATTVIEVGVNVPNASVMVIENAERFGLSQLHQLRGRVGRGADQSYCILMTKTKISDDATTRVETMCRTHDGFEIADVDLQLRGPGDIMGTRQSGVLEYKVAQVLGDRDIMEEARHVAEKLLEQDPHLEAPANHSLRNHFSAYAKQRIGWSRIA